MMRDSQLEEALEASANRNGIGAVLETLQHWALNRADKTPENGVQSALRDLGGQAYTVLDLHSNALGIERIRRISDAYDRKKGART